MIKLTCHKHGEVESEPNANHRAYCPKCVAEAMQASLPPGSSVMIDKGHVSAVSIRLPLQVSKMRLAEDGSVFFEREPSTPPQEVKFSLEKAGYANVEPATLPCEECGGETDICGVCKACKHVNSRLE